MIPIDLQKEYYNKIRKFWNTVIPGLEDQTLEFDIKTSIFNALQKRGHYALGISGGPDDILNALRDDGFEITRKKK
jgi:hypothetical protein